MSLTRGKEINYKRNNYKDVGRSSPLVSILIPVYNRVNLIEQCVDSAINQDYDSFEIIIVDNNSSDGTFELCISKYSNKVKVYQNEKNIGPVQNWKKCIEYASGEYSKILFSDDSISSNYLTETMKLMNDHIGFVFSSAFIGKNKNSAQLNYKWNIEKINSDKYIEYSLLKPGALLSPGAAIFRTFDLRECFVSNIPNFNSKGFSYYGAGPDLLLFLNIANKYEFVCHCNSTSVFFREHSGSATTKAHRLKQWPIRSCYNMARSWFATDYIKKNIIISKLAARIIVTELIENKDITLLMYKKNHKFLRQYFQNEKIYMHIYYPYMCLFVYDAIKYYLWKKFKG